MNIKIRRPRSWLGWLAWFLSGLLVIFVLGNGYAQWRMAQVTQDLASLARQLGYTPDSHLHHEIRVRDVSLVTGSAYCDVTLIYTTQISVADFTKRLNQLLPVTKGAGSEETSYYSLYPIADLKINGTDIQKTNVLPSSEREPVTEYSWYSSDSSISSIRLYKTVDFSATIEYKGRRIQDNLVRIQASGGVFPIWMTCPGTSSDAPVPPFE